MSEAQFNSRYVAYCQAHKLTPDEMLQRDEVLWPGGVMCGYMLWIGRRFAEAKIEQTDYFFDGHLYDHVGFDEWLEIRLQELLSKGELG
jgi:hypothetical protein